MEGSGCGHFEFRRLAHETDGVLKNQTVDLLMRVATSTRFERRVWNRKWHAHAPVTGAVHPNSLAAVALYHVDGSRRRAFGLRIQRHARPESSIEHGLDG